MALTHIPMVHALRNAQAVLTVTLSFTSVIQAALIIILATLPQIYVLLCVRMAIMGM